MVKESRVIKSVLKYDPLSKRRDCPSRKSSLRRSSPKPLSGSSQSFDKLLFPPDVTLIGFISQVLSQDHSCRETVARINVERRARGLDPVAPDNSAYCKARARLPEDLLHALFYEIAIDLERQLPEHWKWNGRSVKLVDGTTFSMPDTEDNQAAFPQMASQEEGSGFPIARMVAVLSLATGACLDAAIGPYKGKETGEHALLRQLMHCFNKTDVCLGDAYYPSYFFVSTLISLGVDGVFRQHGARDSDFRRGLRLCKGDHLVEWQKPTRPEWMTEEDYALFPNKIEMRETRVQVAINGFRTQSIVIVSTFADSAAVTTEDLAALYKKRWHIEVDLRSIKIVLQMDRLRCKTPEMVRKELWCHLLGYNLIRKLMAQAATAAKISPREISFKGTVQTFIAYQNLWSIGGFTADEAMWIEIFSAIAHHRVGNRPNRSEPRATKRRPKQYPRLHGNRHEYMEAKMANA